MCNIEKDYGARVKKRELLGETKGRIQMCAELGLSLADISKKVSLSVEDVKKILENSQAVGSFLRCESRRRENREDWM